jgi:signal transduction histidine kinase
LRHIFINLLDNAAKYSPPGSTVEFNLEVRDHLALFTVRDRGIGIADADVRLLFQAFHRGRNVGEIPGTGLGMTIVKRCVELHGGRIAFESREGQGTTFLVALPLFGPTPSGAGEHTTQFLRTAGGPHLTIVS